METEFAVGHTLGQGLVRHFQQHIELVFVENLGALEALEFGITGAGELGHIIAGQFCPFGRIAIHRNRSRLGQLDGKGRYLTEGGTGHGGHEDRMILNLGRKGIRIYGEFAAHFAGALGHNQFRREGHARHVIGSVGCQGNGHISGNGNVGNDLERRFCLRSSRGREGELHRGTLGVQDLVFLLFLAGSEGEGGHDSNKQILCKFSHGDCMN